MTDRLAQWPAFADAVRERLEAGRREYGDRSFVAEPAALVAELAQEALDLAGWGFVLWCRLQAMQEAAGGLPGHTPPEAPPAPAPGPRERWWTMSGVAQAHGVELEMVRAWIASGELASVRVNDGTGRRFVADSDLQRFMESRTSETTP